MIALTKRQSTAQPHFVAQTRLLFHPRAVLFHICKRPLWRRLAAGNTKKRLEDKTSTLDKLKQKLSPIDSNTGHFCDTAHAEIAPSSSLQPSPYLPRVPKSLPHLVCACRFLLQHIPGMVSSSIQDRTNEFRTILTQAQKRHSSTKVGGQRQSLLTTQEKQQANGSTPAGKAGSRSEFARNAAQIGRSITATMGKLERLAQLARKRALFDDRPVEIAELTYIIKQDLASINSQISNLQSINQIQHPNASQPKSADQEGQHNKNVVLMLQNTVTDVAANFKDVLEERTKNIQASRSRQGEFVSSVSARSQGFLDVNRSESPLYQNTGTRQRTPNSSNVDLLSLEPNGPPALTRGGPQSDQQLLMMEEAQPQNQYIEQRGQAIETIERTINELGGIFGQLASMVSEQGEMLQRIDANTEDVVDNVQGAQRELLKYWSRVQGNRWLVAKMFGVLMVSTNLFGVSCGALLTVR